MCCTFGDGIEGLKSRDKLFGGIDSNPDAPVAHLLNALVQSFSATIADLVKRKPGWPRRHHPLPVALWLGPDIQGRYSTRRISNSCRFQKRSSVHSLPLSLCQVFHCHRRIPREQPLVTVLQIRGLPASAVTASSPKAAPPVPRLDCFGYLQESPASRSHTIDSGFGDFG